jgi:hypothetical protein
MPSGHPFHEAGEVPFIFSRINDQVHVVRHQAIRIYSATIRVLPFPQVFKVIQKIPIRDENGLPVMATLDDMMRIAGYYYS